MKPCPDIRWSELLIHFRTLQLRHERSKRQASRGPASVSEPYPTTPSIHMSHTPTGSAPHTKKRPSLSGLPKSDSIHSLHSPVTGSPAPAATSTFNPSPSNPAPLPRPHRLSLLPLLRSASQTNNSSPLNGHAKKRSITTVQPQSHN